MIDDYVADDMVAVENRTRPKDFAIGMVINVGFDTNELSIHRWGSVAKKLLTAALKPEYFDSQDGKPL